MKTILLILSLLIGVTSVNSQELKTIPLNIDLQNFSGDIINTSEIKISSQFVIMDFWNVGCKPCLVQLNEFAEKYDSLKSEGIEVIAISTFPQNVPSFKATEKIINKYNWPFKIYFDVSGKLFKKYSDRSKTVSLTLIFNDQWDEIYKQKGARIMYQKENGQLDSNWDLMSKAYEEGNIDKLKASLEDYLKAISEYREKNNL